MEKLEGVSHRWSVCNIWGYIVACDPGIQNLSSYPREVKREQMKVGMNLCSHAEHLPPVVVREIADSYIVVNSFGKQHKISIDESYYTPKMGLSYAYSKAVVSLK